ncbi:MAG: HmuY family protein [Chloroflexota bacterium]
MNYKKFLAFAAVLTSLFWAGCSEDKVTEPNPNPTGNHIKIDSVKELETFVAGTADTIKYYSLRENKVIPAEQWNTTNWDVAFTRTKILINGGASGPGAGVAALLKNSDYLQIKKAPDDLNYRADSSATNLAIPTGSGNGWYVYNPENHTIAPNPGVVIVLKTANGLWAKMEILGYYKGWPNLTGEPETWKDKTYSFRYSVQKNGTKLFTE